MPAGFFSQEWLDAVRDAVNAGPSPEYKATKLDLYWDWITLARSDFSGSLALGMRGDADQFAILAFESGVCTAAAPAGEGEARAATFTLVGDADDWKAIMNGYDTSKAVMYRKLALENGDVYSFFRRVYFFTEMLVSLAKVPAAFREPAAV